MNHIFDFFFGQYADYSSADTLLEITAVILALCLFGILNKTIFGYFHQA